MRYLFTIIVLLLGVSVLSSCKKSIDIKQMQSRGGLAYEEDAEKPYSGEVLEYYDDDDKKIKSKVYFKDGKFDGVCLFYHENGQLSEEDKYVNGKQLESKNYFDNGQILGEVAYSDGKIIKMINYLRNGEKELILENDPGKSIVKFLYQKGHNEIDRIGYYLNSKIFPMMSFIEMSGKSPEELFDKFGEVNAEDIKESLVNYKFKFYSADEGSSDLINKAVVVYVFMKLNDGSVDPLSTQIVYYNQSENEKMEKMAEVEKYFLTNGFTATEQNTFENDKFWGNKIEINNNFGYMFFRKKGK
jgi:antitoxin component YwqK of YwqJK toxin-antitoxin module